MLGPGKRGAYIRGKIRRAYDEVCSELDGIKRSVGSWFFKTANRKTPERYQSHPHYIRNAVKQYQAKPFAGKITLFRALRQPMGIVADRALGWKNLAAEIDIHDVPGFHANIVGEPRVGFLVQKLRPALAAAQKNAALRLEPAADPHRPNSDLACEDVSDARPSTRPARPQSAPL